MKYTRENKEYQRRIARGVAQDLYRVLCTPTLDGHLATIGGWNCEFATVARIDGKYSGVEFSWETVCRVLSSGGKFRA